MVVGPVKAAEALASPLILAFNQGATPDIPLEIGIALAVDVASKASVPVAVILDHGASAEQVVVAIRHGASSVMFDGSHLPYEENVARTRDIVSLAHAVGVDVEAELGAVGGSSVYLGDAGPEATMTDPEQAVDFVARTGVDVLAISFGNAHGVYQGAPQLDMARVRRIRERVGVPLAMHGASGLPGHIYAQVVDSGISKICYYTAMGRQVSQSIRAFTGEASPDALIYHQVIAHTMAFFVQATSELLTTLGSAGRAMR
jgi:fructose-bisphosphate aldolase class II